MKSMIKLFAFIIALSLVAMGCNKDEPEQYWYNYGTYLDSDLSTFDFILKMDNGDTIIPISVDYIQDGIENGSRVIPVYAIQSEEGKVIQGKISKIEKILTKDIIQLTEENEDSIGNDQIMVWEENIWLTENHLNVIFGYFGGGVTHYINLVKPIGTQLDSAGRQILEFRHNANNEYYNYEFRSIVSFDMWSIYQEGMDTLNIIFKTEDYLGEEFLWEGTYVYNTDELSAKFPKLGEPQLLNAHFE